MQLRGRKAAEKFKVNTNLPPVEPSKTATKENGLIKSYAVNTHQGISRNYNEDRVSVTLNITKNEIKSHFFAVYDGHGGTRCCDFLKDHLHELIINNEHFPSDPKKAIGDSIIECENLFVEYGQKKYEQTGKVEKSGSCAIVVMTIGLECYVANVGDSRAIVSTEGGKFAYNLNRDHKPTDKREQVRILSLGGKIYRTEMTKIQDNTINEPPLIGPLRVFPGKLSVTRTIGDIEAKSKQFGGIPECISIIPEIRKFKLTSKEDFILLCCDGIVEKMESVDIVRHVWKVLKEYK